VYDVRIVSAPRNRAETVIIATDVIEQQRLLWSANPHDWAQLAEPQTTPLFERLLDLTGAGAATRALDLACGSGLLSALAAGRGAQAAGVDVTPELLEIARRRVPDGDFRVAAMEELPFEDSCFEVVTAVNALQFSVELERALAEAVRVLDGGGSSRFAAAVFAEPERNQGTALQRAMAALVSDGDADGYAPYGLSSAGALEAALAGAGLSVIDAGELPLAWSYPDIEALSRGLLASAGGARASRAAGEDRVREAIAGAARPFQDGSGAVTLRNVFRYAVAVKP
jgi:SAM-dependent methyltransferase